MESGHAATLQNVRRDCETLRLQREGGPAAALASIIAQQTAISDARMRTPAELSATRTPSALMDKAATSKQATAPLDGLPPTAAERPLSELESLRGIFPNSTQRELGFHTNFRDRRLTDVKQAEATLRSITAAQLKADPVLADAVAYMRSRSIQLHNRAVRADR